MISSTALAAGLILNAEKERAASAAAVGETVQKLRFDIDNRTKQLNALLDLVISGQITQDEYAQKKRSLIDEKKELQDKVAAFERQGAKHNSDKTGVNRFEPEINLYREAVLIGEVAGRGKPEENREKLKKIGSNFRLREKRLTFELKQPWEFLLNLNSARAKNTQNLPDFLKSKFIRPLRDSNP